MSMPSSRARVAEVGESQHGDICESFCRVRHMKLDTGRCGLRFKFPFDSFGIRTTDEAEDRYTDHEDRMTANSI